MLDIMGLDIMGLDILELIHQDMTMSDVSLLALSNCLKSEMTVSICSQYYIVKTFLSKPGTTVPLNNLRLHATPLSLSFPVQAKGNTVVHTTKR